MMLQGNPTDQRDAQNKYSKDEMKSQEPFASLFENVSLFRSPLWIGHLIKHISQGLQFWSLATVETYWSSDWTYSIDKTTGQVKTKELEGDSIEEDDDAHRDENKLFEEDSEESNGSDTVDDCAGVERQGD